MDRIIGSFKGDVSGPMLICIGGIHGNEPAGVEAVQHIMNLLSIEPLTNPDFSFKGSFVGIRGNLMALKGGCRFIEKDLNRSLMKDHVKSVLESEPAVLQNEDREIYELVNTIRAEIKDKNPTEVVVLDLHTTSSGGGIFVLTSREEQSIDIGMSMNAPVITGFADSIEGTTMEYFVTENFGVPMTSVVFEGGQHRDPVSVNRIIAAVLNCLSKLGCIQEDDIDNRHNYILKDYSRDLPKVSKLLYRYDVHDVPQFRMLPDLQNYMPVSEGEVLAYENGEEIRAPFDGLLIMPKYQPQGTDGFFIVQPLEGY